MRALAALRMVWASAVWMGVVVFIGGSLAQNRSSFYGSCIFAAPR